jgi:hypothetical protein
MADYQSKHTGAKVDSAVDKIDEITESEMRMIHNFRAASSCILAKNASGNLQKLEIPTVSSTTDGFMFMENGKIKVGKPSGSTLSMLSSVVDSGSKKYTVKGLYNLQNNIKVMNGPMDRGSRLTTGTVEDLNVIIVKEGNVVQYRLEFKMPHRAKELSGNFSNICIAKLKTDTAPFKSLGLTRNTLIPSTPCALTTIGAGPLMHGYVSEYGNIFLAGIGGTAAKLTGGDKVILGGTYIAKP